MGTLNDLNQSYNPIGIICDVKCELGLRISYDKARRGKKIFKNFHHMATFFNRIIWVRRHIEINSRIKFHYFLMHLVQAYVTLCIIWAQLIVLMKVIWKVRTKGLIVKIKSTSNIAQKKAWKLNGIIKFKVSIFGSLLTFILVSMSFQFV